MTNRSRGPGRLGLEVGQPFARRRTGEATLAESVRIQPCRRLGVVEGTGSAIGTVEAVTSETGTCGSRASRTSVPQSASDLERPMKMTPTIMATMQAASAASPAYRNETVSPRRNMPSAIPGDRFGGGDRRQRVVQPSSLKRALRDRDADDCGTDHDVDPCVEEYLTEPSRGRY